MQSTSHISYNTIQFQSPWKTHKSNHTFTIPKLRKPKTLTLSYSLKISYGSEFEGIETGDDGPQTLNLPVVIRKSGKVSRYFWDGTHLKLVSLDRKASNLLEFDNGFRNFYQLCSSSVRNFFIPQQVQENYMEYVKWKLLHRVFSSALQVLATQAMFRAMGVGFSRSLPSAAALNWVLKDGLGRLSRCIYTASLASAFDTNLKRVRFTTSVMFTISIGIELLTPAFPRYFLLLATVANIAKQISLACYLATGSAVHRSFAVADNLGEVSAKAQIQTVCFDNLGLMLAAILNILCKNNQRLQAGLPFLVYPIFSAMDLLGIYQGLKHVHLHTLTKDRLEIILDTWIRLGFIPSPAEVSEEEGIGFPWREGEATLWQLFEPVFKLLGNEHKCEAHRRSMSFFFAGREPWPIRVGSVDPKDSIPKFSMLTMWSLREEDFHFVCMESINRSFTSNVQHGILLCLREGAGITDIITGLLQACHVRKALRLSDSRWENILEANDVSISVLREWFEIVENSKRCTHGEVDLLKEQLQRSGWSVKNILLSVQEQVRYSLLDD